MGFADIVLVVIDVEGERVRMVTPVVLPERGDEIVVEDVARAMLYHRVVVSRQLTYRPLQDGGTSYMVDVFLRTAPVGSE